MRPKGPPGGEVLVDCTAPLEPDRSGLSVGHATSAAEEIAKRAPGARVVKAFSPAFQEMMIAPGELFGPYAPSMFHCGDDGTAKEVVAGLVGEAGFEPVEAGPLQQARYLEPLAFLVISLAARGRGLDFMMTLRAGARARRGIRRVRRHGSRLALFLGGLRRALAVVGLRLLPVLEAERRRASVTARCSTR